MNERTVNIDVEVHYQWYDHLVLRDNGDAEIVTKAIEEGDFDTFIEMVKRYSPNDENGLIFFPNEAYLYYRDEIIGRINIMSQTGFSLITSSEYECG